MTDIKELASPRPWKYVNTNGNPVKGMADWIEDATGSIMVENVGHIDGPLIVRCVNASPAPAERGAVAWMTADGRIATDETKRTAMASPSRAAFNIPLFPHPPAPSASMGRVTEELIGKCLEAMAQSTVTYPDGEVSAPLIEWFKIDAQDALDFGVLKEPKFDSYSDIAVMQQEWYVEELLRQPFKNALKVLLAALDAPPDQREHGCEAEAFTLNEWIFANNARKSEAVAELTALTAKVALLTEALKYAAMGLGRIHDSLLSNGPKQASGEMTMHFRDAARRALSEPDKEGT